MQIKKQILTGETEEHVVPWLGTKILLHREVLAPLTQMQLAAKKEGIDLQVASGFRSFQRQLEIWNAKALGQKPLLDANSHPVPIEALSKKERLYAILRWSALPGASRHHWGTDFDIFDKAAVASDYKLQLIPQEYVGNGVFARLTEWLDANMQRFGFFRSYDRDRGGVSPEPWHLSYAPLSAPYLVQFTEAVLKKTIEETHAIELKTEILEELPTIFKRFITNVNTLP